MKANVAWGLAIAWLATFSMGAAPNSGSKPESRTRRTEPTSDGALQSAQSDELPMAGLSPTVASVGGGVGPGLSFDCGYRSREQTLEAIRTAVQRGEIDDPSKRALPPRPGGVANAERPPCGSTPTPADIFPFADTGGVLLTNFSDGQLFDLMTAGANALIAAHGDNFDFIAFWVNFTPNHQIGGAFYLSLFNDVSGIGQGLYDDRASFGLASSEVEGYVMMWNINTSYWQPGTGTDAADFTRLVLAQEFEHRFGMFLPNLPGGRRLQGDDAACGRSAHWNFKVDGQGSGMEIREWIGSAPAVLGGDCVSFAAEECLNTDTGGVFSHSDLYLMGYDSPAEMDAGNSELRYMNTSCASPYNGVISTFGSADIIASAGVRSPTSATAQKHFRTGWVMIHQPGSPPTTTQLDKAVAILTQQTADWNFGTQGRGTLCNVLQPGPPVKFSQLPDSTGEDAASNIDLTDLAPNTVVADDFVSDGRPITGVVWWGSNVSASPIDGWTLGFHEPLAAGGSATPPLALYFCDAAVVDVASTSLAACDAHPVMQYQANLVDCCLVHALPDSRNGLNPGQPDAFHETQCYAYDLDIQAVVGHKFTDIAGVCTDVVTGNTATGDFWGWHTTNSERGLRPALQSTVSMSGSDWLYGPWSTLSPVCSSPNMAFQLLTDVSGGEDCNDNGLPDDCEIAAGAPDCQPNGVLDECELDNGTSRDCNHSGIPDECELPSDPDCNGNGILDECDNVEVGSLTGAFAGVLGFVDISGTGVPLNLADDAATDVVMPFAPSLVGGATISVANNGGVGLVPGSQLASSGNPNQPLPSVEAFGGNAGMLAYWDDLHESTGNVYYQTVGVSPNRTFIVQWDDLENFSIADGFLNGNEITFQIQIFETPVGGVVAQYLYADTNFLNPSYDNGRSATVGYQRSPTSALQWSFNAAGAVKPGIVVSLVKGDATGNGRPDECDPVSVNVVWDSDESSPERTTRSLRFRAEAPPTAAALSGLDAIKVTMVDLQHPDPRNLPQYPPPNYSTFDIGTHGTCAGATTGPNYNGHHCSTDPECLGPDNGTPSDDGTCSAGPACTAAGEANGCARWVGRPGTFYESQGPPLTGPYRASRLQCTPAYWDWMSEPDGLVTVVGAEIVPSSEYGAQVYGASCIGREAACTNVSAPMTMYTRRKGDLDGPYQGASPAPLTQADVLDISQAVASVKHQAGSPAHYRAQMQPNLPELNADANVLDIVEAVDSVKRVPYAFSGPCVCPSTVICGGSCTGCAGLCVKTCVGGDNAGEPCINNTHCPGGGYCNKKCVGGTNNNGPCSDAADCPGAPPGVCTDVPGTCRDKCGRCTP